MTLKLLRAGRVPEVAVPALYDQPQHSNIRNWRIGLLLRFAAWVALVTAFTASLALRQADTRFEFDLLPKDMAHNEGVAFQAPIGGQVSWPWGHAPDDMSNPRQSQLILFEDGRP